MDETKQPGLQIGQVFLLAAAFGHRPDAFSLPHTTPIGDIPLTLEAKASGKLGEPSAAIRLRAFTPKERDDLLYAFDIEIAAIVSTVPGEENMDPFEYVRTNGPASLMPFLRETVASVTMRGRFGPVWLKEINFQVALNVEPAGEA